MLIGCSLHFVFYRRKQYAHHIQVSDFWRLHVNGARDQLESLMT